MPIQRFFICSVVWPMRILLTLNAHIFDVFDGHFGFRVDKKISGPVELLKCLIKLDQGVIVSYPTHIVEVNYSPLPLFLFSFSPFFWISFFLTCYVSHFEDVSPANFTICEMNKYTMVLELDGSSGNVAHVWRKTDLSYHLIKVPCCTMYCTI